MTWYARIGNGALSGSSGAQPGDYHPVRNIKPVQLRVTRACLVQLREGDKPAEVAAGVVVEVPHYIAIDVVWAGRGEILTEEKRLFGLVKVA
ncbi:hypothetical protein MASR1M60_30620 [Rhodocyclaceae bacterium]